MLRKLGAASCIPALAYNPARSMNCGSNAHSLYVARCPAGDHIRWTARKAVSLRRSFGEPTRAVDPAPLFHALLFRPDGILGRVAAQILCTRSIDAERLPCKNPTRRTRE